MKKNAVWVDSLTPKQARIAVEIYNSLSKLYNVIITARKYDYTLKIFDLFDVPYTAIGRHGGGTLEGKLLASTERAYNLAKFISSRGYEIKCLISYPSPEAVRVAFGLGIPIIILTDTPHARHASLLTLPFADKIIVPKCIKPEAFSYATPNFAEKIIRFEGIFEKIWIHKLPPPKESIEELGLEIGKYIVIRLEESKAAYYQWREKSPSMILAKKIQSKIKDIDIVFMPRYEDQKRVLRKEFPYSVILEKAVDSLPLVYYAKAVITGGGTLAHEAALVGTPAVTLFPKHYEVEEYLQKKGFPLLHVVCVDNKSVEKILQFIETKGSARDRYLSILNTLEDPMRVIIECLKLLER